jgi:hypothetical protein
LVATATLPSNPPKRERAGIAHEDLSGRRIEPQKAQTRPDHRPAKHRQLTGAGHEIDAQIVGEECIARQIGDQPEGGRRDHHRHDGQPIEAIGEVHRIAGPDNNEARQRQ